MTKRSFLQNDEVQDFIDKIVRGKQNVCKMYKKEISHYSRINLSRISSYIHIHFNENIFSPSHEELKAAIFGQGTYLVSLIPH